MSLNGPLRSSSHTDKFHASLLRAATTTSGDEHSASFGRKIFTNKAECMLDPPTFHYEYQILEQNFWRRKSNKYLLQRRIGALHFSRRCRQAPQQVSQPNSGLQIWSAQSAADTRTLVRKLRQMNGFLELAKRQLSVRSKTRHRRVGRRRRQSHRSVSSRAAPDHQLRAWNQWRRERLETLLVGPHGRSLQQLIRFLETMTVRDAPALIALVKLGQWQRTDPNTRFEVRSLIDEHIIKLREAHGLAPSMTGRPTRT
jgi:hypothetical protein